MVSLFIILVKKKLNKLNGKYYKHTLFFIIAIIIIPELINVNIIILFFFAWAFGITRTVVNKQLLVIGKKDFFIKKGQIDILMMSRLNVDFA
jgi:hypothetical protein